MSALSLVFGLMAFFLVMTSITGDVIYYVSTQGNDDWSGKLAVPNAEKTDGPFATIAKARDAIRQLKASGALREAVTVQIRGGLYYISEPIVFSPEDSGSAECPVSYMAYPGEKPVLCGGRKIVGFKPYNGSIYSVELPEVKAGKWYFRQLFVDDERQIRARCPNFDPSDPYRKGFFYVDRGAGGFGVAVGCIHNVGDWMEYNIEIPADGEYQFWLYYAALNKPFGTNDMAARTALIVDGGEPVPLMNLPDTGGWRIFKWSRSATLRLTKGSHVLRWQNIKGGGLDLEAYALTDDPEWAPVTTKLPKVAEGKHLVVIQAEDFVRYHGKQLSIGVGGMGSKTEFQYKPGDFKSTWAQAPGAEVHIFQSGSCRAFKEIVSIVKVDEETRTVTVGGKECLAALNPGDRYFVENVFEELDSPGEWYLNKETGVLYYWPKKDVNACEIIAPVVERIFDFQGDPAQGKFVRHIKIAGLSLKVADYSPDDGCEGYGMGKDGVIYMKGTQDCSIQGCTFLNLGKYAVCLNGGAGNTVTENEIAHSAEGGVLILDSARNTISDNHIHHCGAVYKHIGGVVLQGPGASENIVSHNLIHDSARYGITLKNPGTKNIIEYNKCYNLNTETYDTGGIEVTQHDRNFRSGSIIRNNIVHDAGGYSFDGQKDIYCSWGIYLDSFAGGYTVANNIVYRNSHGGIMLQGGKDNTVTNNIFVDSTMAQGCINNFAKNSSGLVLERNIFYYSAPEAILFATGALTPEIIKIDHNLYFHTGGKEIRVGWGGKKSFAEWQKEGFDTNSIIADPLFVDPKNDNYELRPESPAFKLGFKPIDIKDVGPRKRRD